MGDGGRMGKGRGMGWVALGLAAASWLGSRPAGRRWVVYLRVGDDDDDGGDGEGEVLVLVLVMGTGDLGCVVVKGESRGVSLAGDVVGGGCGGGCG